MEQFIRQENIALFRRRLEGPCTVAEREVLLKLLAEEEKKECRLLKDEKADGPINPQR